MIGVDGNLRTEDMTLATVLLMHGYQPTMSRVDGSVEFLIKAEDIDGDTHELIEEYVSGACLVEPKRFTRELAGVRKDVYRLMDHHKAKRGTQVRRGRHAAS